MPTQVIATAPASPQPPYEFINSKTLAQRWCLPESWVPEQVRTPSTDPIPISASPALGRGFLNIRLVSGSKRRSIVIRPSWAVELTLGRSMALAFRRQSNQLCSRFLGALVFT